MTAEAPKRIFVAALATETNTFSPIVIDRKGFEDSLYAAPGQHPVTPTLCTAPIPVGRRVCTEKGWHLIEGTAAWADPAGLVARGAYEGLRDEILDQLRAALPVDAVVLGLHGAMVAQGYLDPEGDLLTRVRAIVGPDVLVCAELDRTTITIDMSGSEHQFVAQGEVIRFDGFLRLYSESTDDDQSAESGEGLLPKLTAGDRVLAAQITATERFTTPPARYNEASLVKRLEELGIGRPSTYAPTITTIINRGYVVKQSKEGQKRSYLQLTLSVSLHSPDDESRSKIMPVNRRWPVDTLLAACRDYFAKTGRRISFEYTMIDGVSDSPEQAELLSKKLAGMGAHVNMIPLNNVTESGLHTSSRQAIHQFQSILEANGITATLRRTLGSDIDASCGQLRKKVADHRA